MSHLLWQNSVFSIPVTLLLAPPQISRSTVMSSISASTIYNPLSLLSRMSAIAMPLYVSGCGEARAYGRANMAQPSRYGGEQRPTSSRWSQPPSESSRTRPPMLGERPTWISKNRTRQTEAESALKVPIASTRGRFFCPFLSKLMSVFPAERREREAPQALWSLWGKYSGTIRNEKLKCIRR